MLIPNESVGLLQRIAWKTGPWATVPELLFEKKGLIPALQQLMVSCSSDLT